MATTYRHYLTPCAWLNAPEQTLRERREELKQQHPAFNWEIRAPFNPWPMAFNWDIRPPLTLTYGGTQDDYARPSWGGKKPIPFDVYDSHNAPGVWVMVFQSYPGYETDIFKHYSKDIYYENTSTDYYFCLIGGGNAEPCNRHRLHLPVCKGKPDTPWERKALDKSVVYEEGKWIVTSNYVEGVMAPHGWMLPR